MGGWHGFIHNTDQRTRRKKIAEVQWKYSETFAAKIRKLKENPGIHGKPLRGALHGYWELYFENKFRIIYTIDPNEKTVTIEAIKHKNEI